MESLSTHKKDDAIIEEINGIVAQHKALHAAYHPLLDASGHVPRNKRCDPTSLLDPNEPLIYKLLDHYLNSGCTRLPPGKETGFHCGQCDAIRDAFQKELVYGEKLPHFTTRQRLAKQLR
jgi:hypothetical protein